MKFEGISMDNKCDLHFIIYKGIKEKLDNAINDKETDKIQQFQELINWYKKEIILNSNTLEDKLFSLKNL